MRHVFLSFFPIRHRVMENGNELITIMILTPFRRRRTIVITVPGHQTMHACAEIIESMIDLPVDRQRYLCRGIPIPLDTRVGSAIVRTAMELHVYST